MCVKFKSERVSLLRRWLLDPRISWELGRVCVYIPDVELEMCVNLTLSVLTKFLTFSSLNVIIYKNNFSCMGEMWS